MTDSPEKIQYSLLLIRPQLDSLNRIKQNTGINLQSLIRLAIHNFCLSQDSTYRLNQQDEQIAEEAAK